MSNTSTKARNLAGLLGTTQGRPVARAIRPLGLGELNGLDKAGEDSAKRHVQPEIKELRQRHHTIARLLAEGRTETEVATIVCITVNRVSVLKADPSFQELVAYYRGMEAEHYKESRAKMHERLAELGFDSIQELHQRLEDSPGLFTNDQLLKMLEATADRTGFGKTQTVNANVQHSISDEVLARIRQGANGGPDAGEISHAAADRESLLRLVHRATEGDSAPEASDWIEGSGILVREESHSETQTQPEH